MTTSGATRTSSSVWSLAACRRRLIRLLAAPIALLFPPACVRCGRSVPLGQIICTSCLPSFDDTEGPCCLVCGDRVEDASLDLCLRCGVRPQSFERLIALGSYDDAWGDLVRTLKFERETAVGRWLAGCMADRVSDDVESSGEPFDWITFVPMSAGERRDRGFNQSRLLARLVARRLRLPYRRSLRKIRRTRRQSSLPARERRRNLQGAYRSVTSRTGRVLLVDDIFTTGSTANACAQALREAGCESVTVLVVARA